MAADLLLPAGTQPLLLFADTSPSGIRVHEEVVVEMLGENEFRLVQSPGLVLGLAAGDTFELRDDRSHRLLRRGGNICVQLYRNGTVDEWRPLTEEILGEVGARLDGASDEQLVFTVPAAGGFPRLEAALAQVVAAFPRCQWFYGNVYDERDGTTPLNWWLSRSESQT